MLYSRHVGPSVVDNRTTVGSRVAGLSTQMH